MRKRELQQLLNRLRKESSAEAKARCVRTVESENALRESGFRTGVEWALSELERAAHGGDER